MAEDAYARKEGFPTKVVMVVLAGIVIALWFVFGYGYFTSPLQESSEPPTIWVVYKGDVYTGMQGSYCWADICVDKMFQYPSGTINVERNSSINLMLNSLIRPSEVTVQVFVINNDTPLQIKELQNEGSNRYTVNLESGVYILNTLARWNDLGEVTYRFKISVS
jgi:hypothetical protein